jgi:hypothetical protein
MARERVNKSVKINHFSSKKAYNNFIEGVFGDNGTVNQLLEGVSLTDGYKGGLDKMRICIYSRVIGTHKGESAAKDIGLSEAILKKKGKIKVIEKRNIERYINQFIGNKERRINLTTQQSREKQYLEKQLTNILGLSDLGFISSESKIYKVDSKDRHVYGNHLLLEITDFIAHFYNKVSSQGALNEVMEKKIKFILKNIRFMNLREIKIDTDLWDIVYPVIFKSLNDVISIAIKIAPDRFSQLISVRENDEVRQSISNTRAALQGKRTAEADPEFLYSPSLTTTTSITSSPPPSSFTRIVSTRKELIQENTGFATREYSSEAEVLPTPKSRSVGFDALEDAGLLKEYHNIQELLLVTTPTSVSRDFHYKRRKALLESINQNGVSAIHEKEEKLIQEIKKRGLDSPSAYYINDKDSISNTPLSDEGIEIDQIIKNKEVFLSGYGEENSNSKAQLEALKVKYENSIKQIQGLEEDVKGLREELVAKNEELEVLNKQTGLESDFNIFELQEKIKSLREREDEKQSLVASLQKSLDEMREVIEAEEAKFQAEKDVMEMELAHLRGIEETRVPDITQNDVQTQVSDDDLGFNESRESLASSRGEIDILQDNLSSLRVDLESAISNEESARKQAERLEEELGKSLIELESCKRKSLGRDSEVLELKQKVENLEKVKVERDKILTQFNQESESLKQEIYIKNQDLEALKSRHEQELASQEKSFKIELASKEKQMQEAANAGLANKLKSLQREHEDLFEERKVESEMEIAAQQERVIEMSEQVASSKVNLEIQETKISQLQETKSLIQQENQKLEGLVRHAQESRAELAGRELALQEELERLKVEKEKEGENHRVQMQHLQSQVDESFKRELALKESEAMVLTKLELLNEQIKELQNRDGSDKIELNGLNALLVEREESLSDVKSNAMSAEAERDSARDAIAKLKEKLETSLALSREEKASVQERVVDLRAKLAQSKAQELGLKESLRALQSEEINSQEKEREIEGLENELAQTRGSFIANQTRLEVELEQLKTATKTELDRRQENFISVIAEKTTALERARVSELALVEVEGKVRSLEEKLSEVERKSATSEQEVRELRDAKEELAESKAELQRRSFRAEIEKNAARESEARIKEFLEDQSTSLQEAKSEKTVAKAKLQEAGIAVSQANLQAEIVEEKLQKMARSNVTKEIELSKAREDLEHKKREAEKKIEELLRVQQENLDQLESLQFKIRDMSKNAVSQEEVLKEYQQEFQSLQGQYIDLEVDNKNLRAILSEIQVELEASKAASAAALDISADPLASSFDEGFSNSDDEVDLFGVITETIKNGIQGQEINVDNINQPAFQLIPGIRNFIPAQLTKDVDMSTLLMFSSYLGLADVVSLLLDLGADVLAKDSKGKIALHYASLNTNVSDEVGLVIYDHLITNFEKLLKRGEGIEMDLQGYLSLQDSKGNMPLHYACEANKPQLAKIFKDSIGVEIFSENNTSRTCPFSFAVALAEQGDLRLLNLISNEEKIRESNDVSKDHAATAVSVGDLDLMGRLELLGGGDLVLKIALSREDVELKLVKGLLNDNRVVYDIASISNYALSLYATDIQEENTGNFERGVEICRELGSRLEEKENYLNNVEALKVQADELLTIEQSARESTRSPSGKFSSKLVSEEREKNKTSYIQQ